MSSGSGAALNGVAAIVTDCLFQENRSEPMLRNSTFGGGAIAADFGGATMSVTRCVFIKNSAKFGGAIRASGISLDVRDSIFSENTAFERGGAILSYSMSTLESLEFDRNTAPLGAALYVSGTTQNVVINACSFDTCCQVFPWTFEPSGDSSLGWPCINCVGDVTCDGQVTAADLGRFLGGWGGEARRFDFDGNGSVDAFDLGALLASWGACL